MSLRRCHAMTPRRRSEIGKPFGSQLTLKVRDFWGEFSAKKRVKTRVDICGIDGCPGWWSFVCRDHGRMGQRKMQAQLLWKSDHQCVNRQVHQLSGFFL